jgi:hypothetical protein
MEARKNPFLEWALFYALERHWPVFPVKPWKKKPPLTPNGLNDATLDEAQIRKWWDKTPNANVAVRTGVENFVLDRDGTSENTYALLVQQHGRFTNTLQATTPNKGIHDFYRYKPGNGIKIGTHAPARKDWPGIDVRGEGGYVLVHPSIIVNKQGKRVRYEWDSAKEFPEEEALSAAPSWLIDAIREREESSEKPNHNGNGHFILPDKIRHSNGVHEQHDVLCQYIGQLISRHLSKEEVYELAWHANITRCEKPGPEEEIHQYVDSLWKKDQKKVKANSTPLAQKRELVLPEPLMVGDILDAKVKRPEALVDQLMPRYGLTMITGAQRSGKTIFASQLAISLATNQALFQNYRLNTHGPVIFIERDDPGATASFQDMYIRAKVPREAIIAHYPKDRIPCLLGHAFLEWLDIIVPKLGAVLVVLDSYTALRPERQGRSDVVKVDTQEVGELDELAKRREYAILMLHHESITTRSNANLDCFDRAAGTYGLGAATECQIAITRYPKLGIDAFERLLRFRSRHMREHQLTLRYNPSTGIYEHVVDGAASLYYESIQTIQQHVRTPEFTADELKEPLGISRSQAFVWITKFLAAGLVWKLKNGSYRFAPHIERLNVIPPVTYKEQ